jgi:hypothetical protein
MAVKNVATLREVQIAQKLMKALGIRSYDPALLYVVLAWMRVESGTNLSKLTGNNVFGAFIIRLVFHGDKVYGESWTTSQRIMQRYKTIDLAIAAAAKMLTAKAGEKAGYGLFFRALRRGKASAASDALQALTLSQWDEAHFSYIKRDGQIGNRLYDAYTAFTGMAQVQPKQLAQKPPPPPMPLPKVPRTLQAPVPHTYISGYAAQRFYDERHKGIK